MSINRCDDVNELHPKLKELAIKLLEEASRQGMKAKVIDTYRSAARQDYLYAQGRSRPGIIVTNATGKDMSSYHNWRLAFDCVQDIPGREYEAAFLAKLGKIGKSLGLEWGGGWSSFKDAPHFQYTFGLSIKELNSGKKPPAYVPVKQQDDDLVNAVNKLVINAVKINAANWNDVSKMDMRWAQALLEKIGQKFGKTNYPDTVDYLVSRGCIKTRVPWDAKNFKAEWVRALIINVSQIL